MTLPPMPFCDHPNQRVVQRVECPDCAMGVTLTGVRSSEVDGLREALTQARDYLASGSGVVGVIAFIDRALTGDTGPKVEPEPQHDPRVARPGECPACLAGLHATPEPSNDD